MCGDETFKVALQRRLLLSGSNPPSMTVLINFPKIMIIIGRHAAVNKAKVRPMASINLSMVEAKRNKRWNGCGLRSDEL